MCPSPCPCPKDPKEQTERNEVGHALGHEKPLIVHPACELWLYENPKALVSVKKGLKQADEGKLVDRGSFAKHARDCVD